jgi:structure-specific recognition protein 1
LQYLITDIHLLETNSSEDIEKYDRLKKNYEDPTFEVVSGVFRALAKKKIIGAGSFQR